MRAVVVGTMRRFAHTLHVAGASTHKSRVTGAQGCRHRNQSDGLEQGIGSKLHVTQKFIREVRGVKLASILKGLQAMETLIERGRFQKNEILLQPTSS